MILSDLSIKRPFFATVMMLALVVLGIFSFKRLGVEMFPSVEFPLFFGIGAGGEGRAPMARAVVGGLLTATLLTLLVVPVMYTYMDDLGGWLKRRWGKHA